MDERVTDDLIRYYAALAKQERTRYGAVVSKPAWLAAQWEALQCAREELRPDRCLHETGLTSGEVDAHESGGGGRRRTGSAARCR